MKISEKTEKALDDQIKEEIASGYLYMAMAAYFDSINLRGFAHWMKAQAAEEWGHAMKMYEFVFEQGGVVRFRKLDEPRAKWDSPLDAFKAAYDHEVYITGRINELVKMAESGKDFATKDFLQWFVSEQAEEEASANGIVQKLKIIKSAPDGLYMLDKELSSRK